jgi:DNA-binding CsgD family transcriptional regulator
MIVTGCSYGGRNNDVYLDEAQSLLGEDPEGALSKLNGIDVSDLRDSATMARWALLYSEAMVANKLTAPTDTIVNIAIDYYGRHGQQAFATKAKCLKIQLSKGTKEDALVSALYLQKEKEFMLYREKSRREQTLFIGIFVLLLASGIIIWQSQRLSIRQTENDALIAEASSLKESMTDRDSKLASLLANRFTLLDELCGTYYGSQGTRTERKAIAEKVRLQIETLQKNDKMFAQIEGTINDCRNNLLMKLKEAIPTLKPEEYRLYALLACGFSNSTIALLLDESIDVVYKRKSRLKAKVSETHEAEFLTVF